MRKTFLLFVLSLFTSILFAQNCESYFPQEVNKKYEYKDYDKKDKETGTTVKTVKEKKDIPGGIAITMQEVSQTKGSDSTNTIEYTIKCENGKMSMDMESMMMNSEQMNAYEGMETKVDADDMTIPENAKAGDDLGGGKVTAEVFNQGVKMMSMTFTITDRKVDAVESVTTSAGTFECLKITSHVEFHMIMTLKMTITEWYAKDIGIVKSETYNKKGKKTTSTVLTKIE